MSEPVTPPAGAALLRETEQQLIRQAQSGDESALEALLSAHQDVVYRTALRFLGGREEAAFELAQEVLISAFRHIKRFRGESRFSTWLYRITSNLAKNRFVVENRERARFSSLETPRSNESGDDAPREWADGQRDVRAMASDREKVALLMQRLEDLEPEWREVLVLRFFEDMSYEEIAEALVVPVGTVKSRLNRARRALREAMGDVLLEGLE